MSSIGATLSRRGWEVAQLDASQPDSADRVRSLAPQALLYDIARAPAAFVLNALSEDPALLLIGVDTSSDRVLILSGEQARAETTTDLVQLLVGSSERFCESIDQPTGDYPQFQDTKGLENRLSPEQPNIHGGAA